MSKERELLRQSLIALEDGPYGWELMEEIQNLLAQPETKQEPVAWMYERQIEGFTERTMSVGFEENFDGVTIPLYTSPRREPLSDDEIGKICKDHFFVASLSAFVRAVEKAHGIGVDDGH